MATLTTHQAHWNTRLEQKEQGTNLWSKWLAFADTQAPKKTMWFMVALMAQGVFFLPMPALLMYYFDAPIFTLGITMGLFFANFIAGMGGSNIRTTLSLFALSVITHLTMLLIFLL